MRAVWLVMTKELRETLRDPHVMVFLAFPVVFYPMLLWGTTQIGMLHEAWTERQPFVVDVVAPNPLREAILADPAVEGSGGLDALRAGTVDVVVETTTEGPVWDITLHHASGRRESKRAEAEVRARLDDVRKDLIETIGAERGLTGDALRPLDIATEDVSTDRSVGATLLGVLFGFLGPFAMLMSGIYPAVDLVVSERERGTLETTLVAPVSRAVLLGGKLLACVALMVFATVANVGTLALTIAQIAFSLELEGGWYLPPVGQLLATLPTILASAVLCAAALLLAMIPARTFKEGELTGSIVLVIGAFPIVAALLALTTGEVDGLLRFVPLANTAIVLHDGVVGELTAAGALIPAVENALLGAVLLALGVRIVGREDYLIGGRLPAWLRWMHRREPS